MLYSDDVLIQQTTLAQISNPSKHDADIMQNWYLRHDLGGQMGLLRGADRYIYGQGRLKVSEHRSDLIAINGSTSDYDTATHWLEAKFVSNQQPGCPIMLTFQIPHWHDKFWSRSHPGIRTYPEKLLETITSVLSTILSSLLPVVSIVVLYLVQSMPARLGIIATFTAGFSVVLSIITSATRSENFAATAAYVSRLLYTSWLMIGLALLLFKLYSWGPMETVPRQVDSSCRRSNIEILSFHSDWS